MRQIKISYNITNRDSEGLEKYLVDISREPMVSVEEETELAHKISLGGPEGEKARDRDSAGPSQCDSVLRWETGSNSRGDSQVDSRLPE